MFTATSITRSLTEFVLPRTSVKRVIASGGGVQNPTIMKFLGELLEQKGLKLEVSDAYGLPAPYKEAIKFGTMAFACKRCIANNIPAAGGAYRYGVLGKLSWAPSKAKFGGEVTGRNERVLGQLGWTKP